MLLRWMDPIYSKKWFFLLSTKFILPQNSQIISEKQTEFCFLLHKNENNTIITLVLWKWSIKLISLSFKNQTHYQTDRKTIARMRYSLKEIVYSGASKCFVCESEFHTEKPPKKILYVYDIRKKEKKKEYGDDLSNVLISCCPRSQLTRLSWI